MNDITNQQDQNIERLIKRDIMCCMSGLVATLAKAERFIETTPGTFGVATPYRELLDTVSQAVELCSPVLDYEEAAIQAGWSKLPNGPWFLEAHANGDHDEDALYQSAEEACEHSDLDPYEWKVCEHWAVSQWLAEKLQAKGQRVDLDFQGLCVWGRTSADHIGADPVLTEISKES